MSAMKPLEIMGYITSRVMVEQREVYTSRIENADYFSVSGRLDNNRPATTTILVDDKGMVNVRLGVPGNGDMGFQFKLFADEATPERVERYFNHGFEKHTTKQNKWDSQR